MFDATCERAFAISVQSHQAFLPSALNCCRFQTGCRCTRSEQLAVAEVLLSDDNQHAASRSSRRAFRWIGRSVPLWFSATQPQVSASVPGIRPPRRVLCGGAPTCHNLPCAQSKLQHSSFDAPARWRLPMWCLISWNAATGERGPGIGRRRHGRRRAARHGQAARGAPRATLSSINPMLRWILHCTVSCSHATSTGTF